MKIIVSDGKTSKTVEIPKEKEVHLYGLKIGQTFDGRMIGIDKLLKITGGSDKDGFPMRSDVEGGRKVKILLKDKPGIRKLKKGLRLKKTVRGNTVNEDIASLNVVVVEEKRE